MPEITEAKVKKDYIFVAEVPEDTVALQWDFFKYYIEKALPDYSSDNPSRNGNLLSAILGGRAKLFTIHKTGEGIQALFILSRMSDPITGDFYLTLLALVSVQELTGEVIEKAKEFLVGETKRLGCKKLVAYTGLKSVVKIAEQMGAKVSWMLTLEV